MKKRIKIIAVILAAVCALAILGGCGKDPLREGKTVVTYWYFADPDEAASIKQSIDWYNANTGDKTDKIYIDGQAKAGGSYVDLIERSLNGQKGPDVFVLADRYIKRWSSPNFPFLENLDPYIAKADLDLSNIWPSAVWRNRYDPSLNSSNLTDPMHAMPRDLSPTAVFYNETMFAKHGVKVISVDEADLAAFNGGAADRRGNTKASLKIDPDFSIPAKGFIRDNPRKEGQLFVAPQYGADGKIAEEIIFNNRIAMSWDEIEDLGMIFTQSYNKKLTAADTKWGYYTEWWFNYGWGVGGDCAVDTTGRGDWTFTLGDKTKKKLLYNADGSHVVDAGGKAVFVPESKWNEPLDDGQTLGTVLPTQYDAFERFVALGKPKSAGGLEIAMRQKADIGTSTPVTFFNNQSVAMLVQPSTSVNTFRKGVNGKFDWDVAPLPVFKEYAADGETVVNKGIEIGHSAQTSIGVWRKSKNKDAAFKVVEYFSMGEAQRTQAQAGLYLPNDRDLAKTDYVDYNLAKNLPPKNIEILTKVAVSQQPGDWWYMPDNKWIDNWATPLNLEYRENNKPLDEFFAAYTASTNKILNGYKK